VSRGTGTVVAITVPVGAVLVLVGLALDGVLGSTLAALGVVLPALGAAAAWVYGFRRSE